MPNEDPRLAEIAIGGLTVNETLLDRGIRHAIYVNRLATSNTNATIQRLNTGVFPRLIQTITGNLEESGTQNVLAGSDRESFNLLRSRLREEGRNLRDALNTLWAPMFDEFATAESAWAVRLFDATIPIDLDLVSPTRAQIRSIRTQRPFEGRLLREWARNIEVTLLDRLDRNLRAALVRGASIDEMVRIVRGTRRARFNDGLLATTRRDAETIVRTATNHFSSHAREIVYAENAAVVKGVRWVSTLDTRTSDICIDLDGRVFDPEQGPRPPAHFRCRSTTVPVVRSWRELGIPLAELPAGTRASMNGQVPAALTYRDWLRRQPRAIQDEVLGVRRARAFRAGRLPRLIDSNLRPLTLDQLLLREGMSG